jgi:hypothetical protein
MCGSVCLGSVQAQDNCYPAPHVGEIWGDHGPHWGQWIQMGRMVLGREWDAWASEGTRGKRVEGEGWQRQGDGGG